ncbi:MAG: Gfo/Idh/MocA family oxidoreductase [Planctomycetota bacterium]
MDKVRLGLIGAGGGMANAHQKYFKDIPGLDYAAASDIDPDALERVKADYSPRHTFSDAREMMDSGEIDAVFIACPHFDHPVFSEYAFERGIHVLCEKPVAVTAQAAAATNAAYEAAKAKHPGLLYAGMFNQRTHADWKLIKRYLTDGTIGELMRVSWTITSWFRSQAYYNSGGWRATWSGEGGGVLINQCPHNLDLFTWWFGTPKKVIALAELGKYHDIEVEDEVSALVQFANGATGTFVTSTAQTPGINRIEIVGENATLIRDDHDFILKKTHQGVREFIQTTKERFGNVTVDEHHIKVGGDSPGHKEITRNFIATILGNDDALIAPATEGIHGLEFGNAMLLSGLENNHPIDLPMDRPAYAAKLEELQANSTYVKPEVKNAGPVAMGSSF